MDATQRFSSRVADYVKYRPGYPDALIDTLIRDGILSAATVIADVGSGTGLLAQKFLQQGNQVFGVEPNPEMRRAGEDQLRPFQQFVSTPGTAEATGLPDHSIDLVTAGQAFHWFDREKARAEFRRILRPPGWVALIWNERLVSTPFLQAYEAMLHRFATDYAHVDHRQITDDTLASFFAPDRHRTWHFENRQLFDYEGVKGRLLSSSYAPGPDHKNHLPMLQELRRIFDVHEDEGQIAFEYKTELSVGRV